jgi:putative transposase
MTAVEVPKDMNTSQVDALPELVDDEFIARLAGQAGAQGLSLVGAGGVLQQLTKRVLEAALEGELDSHLGYGKHENAGRDGGNSRNGRRSKTVVTEAGPVDVEVPRDRDGSFTPQIVAKASTASRRDRRPGHLAHRERSHDR